MMWRKGPGRQTPKQTSQNRDQGRATPAIELQGVRKESIEVARNRMLVAAALFCLGFFALAVRLFDLGVVQQIHEVRLPDHPTGDEIASGRADIVDRNGVILATNLLTHSLYADPKKILDAGEAATKLAKLFPDLNRAEVYSRLTSNARFVWIKRKLTPEQMYEVNRLGIPGLDFQSEEQRIYPLGRLAAHAVGFVNIDGKGLAGIERFFNRRLIDPDHVVKPLRLSLDVRVQQAVRDALENAVQTFQAVGAAGIVMNVHTGEVLALVSLPDFDPNDPGAATPDELFNRPIQGVYEMGSVVKVFTIAMGLDSGKVTLDDGFDATYPIHIGRFTIHDDHAKRRWLSIPEILVYSSNIGAAKLALDVGTDYQKWFLAKMGLLDKSSIQFEELGTPIIPDPWHDINTMTIAFGHGLAITPIQLVSGASALVNGGYLIPATMLAQNGADVSDDAYAAAHGKRVVSARTSVEMRQLMRLVVEDGTGEKADVPGYLVGGKTGTAEKVSDGTYLHHSLLSSFMGAFPMDDPQYMVLIMIDQPKGTAQTFNYATGGWTAAPAVREIVSRIGPMLGVEPRDEKMAAAYQSNLVLPTARQ